MEGQLWKSILIVLFQLGKQCQRARESFSDARIVQVFYWAVIHDRPVCWACERKNWPLHLRRQPLPSDSTMSRRLRSKSVIALLDALQQRVTRPDPHALYWMVDGKPLAISGCSKDRQAGYGKAAGGKAKGYKLHVLVTPAGGLADWRVAPMNIDERVMAQRMLKRAEIQGYVVADGNYDSNRLHAVCDAKANQQFVSPRRGGPGRKLGHRKHTPGRLRSIAMLEAPQPQFAMQLLRDRGAIERYFSQTSCWGGGLTHLPPWARTHRRVRRWVQAKLTLTALKRTPPHRTYVN